MMKLHVFLNKHGSVVAMGPAPVIPGKQDLTGPIFAGFSPAAEAGGLRGFELDVKDDLISPERTAKVVDLFAHLENVIRTTETLKPVEYQRPSVRIPDI